MRRILSGVAVSAVMALWTSPATAQNYRWSVGWNAGVLYTTSLNSGSGAEGVEIKPEATPTVGFQVDRWLQNGTVGFRIGGDVARHDVTWVQGERTIPTFSADVGILLRPSSGPDNSASVYLLAGVGVMRWNFGSGPTTAFPAANASYDGNEGFELTGVAGLGLDIVTSWIWGEGPVVIRLEGRDEIHRSPFDAIAGDSFGITHNLRVTLGLQTGIGLR